MRHSIYQKLKSENLNSDQLLNAYMIPEVSLKSEFQNLILKKNRVLKNLDSEILISDQLQGPQ